jgi:tetratricopeptide (TPR) repeat protein
VLQIVARPISQTAGGREMSYEFSEEEQELWDTVQSSTGREKAEALGKLAEMKLAENKYSQAEAFAAESVSEYRAIGDGQGIGEGLFFRGKALKALKDPAQALGCFEESAEVFRASSNEFFLSCVVAEQGRCYKELGQWNLASHSFDNATTLFASSESWENAGVSALESAECALETKDYVSAELRASQGFDYLVQDENSFLVATALGLRAKSQLGQGNYDSAINDLTESLNIAKYLSFGKMIADTLAELTWAYICAGQLELAAKYLAESRVIHQDAKGVAGLAECDYLAGCIAVENEDYAEAIELFEAARSGFRTKNNKQRVFDCGFNIAKTWTHMDPIKAAAAFDSALKQATDSKLLIDDHTIYLLQAQNFVDLTWTDSALAALANIDVDLLPDQGCKAQMVVLKAQVYLYQRNFSGAIDELQFVLGANALPANKETLLKAKETLGRAYFGEQQYQSAIDALTPVLLEYTLADSQFEAKLVAEIIQEAKHGLETQQLANQPQLWEEEG